MTEDFSDDVKLIKALADENRLAILKLLLTGEKCGCILLQELNITQPTLSHHMKLLCDAGIVKGRKEGKWIHYSICQNGCTKLTEMIKKYTIFTDNVHMNCKKCK